MYWWGWGGLIVFLSVQHSIYCLKNNVDPDQPASVLDLHCVQGYIMCFQKGDNT